MNFPALGVLVLLLTLPCAAQAQATTSVSVQTKAIVEIGSTSVYIGMPQDKVLAALASDGLVLTKAVPTGPGQIIYGVSRIGADGTKKDEGVVTFENGAVANAARIWSEVYNTDGTFARALFQLVKKVKRESQQSCTLAAFGGDLDTDKEWKHITVQCGDKAIDVDLFESHEKDVGSTISLNESIRKK
jgi:hypothetical protein